jgi:prepilin-type N-terminal cleavage/methylation domain-containing protein/prepilin-type processing-associated H-X9-DG protein
MNTRRAYTLLELLVVVAIVAVLVALTAAGVQKVRAAAARADCLNRLRQLSLALHQDQGVRGTFPPGMTGRDDKQYPYLNWHVRLLPYLEQESLWRDAREAFAAEKDFLKPVHEPIRSRVMPSFVCPADHFALQVVSLPGRSHALTSFLGVNGRRVTVKDGILGLDSAVRIADVTDGTSQTIAIGERSPGGAKSALGWWYAGWGSDQNGEAESHLGTRTLDTGRHGAGCGTPAPFAARPIQDPCTPFQFGSVHSGGAHFAFADGSARFLSFSADAILPALASRAGGEAVAVPE